MRGRGTWAQLVGTRHMKGQVLKVHADRRPRAPPQRGSTGKGKVVIDGPHQVGAAILELPEQAIGTSPFVPPTLAALRSVGELPDIKTVSDAAAVPDFRKDAIKRLSYRKFEISDVVLEHATVKPIEILGSPVKAPFGNIVSGGQGKAAALVIAKAPFPAVERIGDL